MLVFLTNLSLFSVTDSFEWFWMESLHRNIQSMLVFLMAQFLVLHFSYYDLPENVICDIAIYADDTTLYCNCDQASDLWQQLELASEFESDLRNTVYWGKK